MAEAVSRTPGPLCTLEVMARRALVGLLFSLGCAGTDQIGAGGGASTATGAGTTIPSGTTKSGAAAQTGATNATSTVTGANASSASSGVVCVDPDVDCPATGTTCRSAVCAGQACATTDAMAGTACNDAGGTVCDGAGNCVAPTCLDGMQNGAELGIDCGGGTCAGCADGAPCNQPTDCASAACVSNVCVACGGAGEPCCAGNTCDALPSTCAQNTGTLWGGTQAECNCGALRAGQVLGVDQGRWSCDGRFFLVMQGDGNLVLYYNSVALWSSNTAGTPVNRAVMEPDGNFVLYDAANQLWWASWTGGITGGWLGVQTDGNVVVYDAANQPWWATDTCCY